MSQTRYTPFPQAGGAPPTPFPPVDPAVPLTYLVIPCYRESRRLPPFLGDLCATLQGSSSRVLVQVVDDGSGESETAELTGVVEEFRNAFPRLLLPALCPPHAGKGGAILHGWSHCPPDAVRLGFVDADGAVPAGEVRRLIELADHSGEPETLWFASRRNSATTTVRRHPLRRFTGRAYALLVNLVLNTRVHDPACGLKLVPRSFFDRWGASLQETGWALDLEILARVHTHRLQLREEPISWREVGESRLVRGDAARIFAALLRIRKRSQDW